VVTAQETRSRDDRYLLLATERTSTMQQEINDAAGRGFRVVATSPKESGEVIVVLEQTNDTYDYRLVAATRTATLQREISDAAEAGYRIVPRAVTGKGDEVVLLMEKGAEVPANVEYQVLSTERTGTLQKEISQASANGYTLVALAGRSEHVAIMERDLP
jgi:phosphoribosylcarboxyaminoimidazole (NCAIR) mutase